MKEPSRMSRILRLQAWAAGIGLALAYVIANFPIAQFTVIYGRF